ncbi:MAG TPA: nucleotidyl transferase AbiEii/AbiGii toxin family protein [Polyangiaceae bacterium]|nr:nucleotidyl transferase AbiEii/AbiGii toxin family protein [Polyangiaceae bacterium]
MADIFIDASERGDIVNNVAATRGVAPWIIEKDLWVCWALARLNEIDGIPQLTFKGGTSLSKVYGLIERFSEDIDLTFSRDGWDFAGERDPLGAGLSGKKRQALVGEIAERSTTAVREVVVPGLRTICTRQIGASGWSVETDAGDPQAVLFTFPNPTAAYGYGQPQVKIEFGARGDPWPTSRKTIVSYVEETHAGTAPAASAEVTALNPERTPSGRR